MEKYCGEALGLSLPAAPSILIESLRPTPMTAILNEIIRQREPGTIRWPFENEMISAWIRGSTDKRFIPSGQETPVSRITKLWLHGLWGSGRTVVTASIIEHLIRECPATHAVGYYFCDRSRLPAIDPLNILRTLIAQLAGQNENACKLIETYLQGGHNIGLPPGNFEAYGQQPASSLNMDTLGKLLQAVSQCFERVSLVINSIDLIDPEAEVALVRLFASLVDSPESKLHVLFSTSTKGQQELLAAEINCCPINVKGSADDIRLFTHAEIARRINSGDAFLQPDHVRGGIEDYIANYSNGAYVPSSLVTLTEA
ncbi:tetratricopeptide repeat domain-containing protein [Penicillium cataractarum]|uniref:Tetratricopeptide repeat domain-containing protein n=1 Tax=Penicillium cataractarum TaxID=2100454 RepID=A0A9W9V694_9EURO|nr:tetratricopeptide repeat domain-containing protein [Penicillium cataractarum]KAJ5370478.1 tetratricopeptide repeat domain-containing protein [Penicillium cataractarum]